MLSDKKEPKKKGKKEEPQENTMEGKNEIADLEKEIAEGKYKIHFLPIKEVKENPSNPRIIKDDKFKKLVESIRTFPKMLLLRPLVLNSDNIVLGGNMRLKALKELKYSKVPFLRFEDLPEKQREFIVKDNNGFGEWDWEMLANEWNVDELDDWGLDVPKAAETGDDFDLPNEEKGVLCRVTFILHTNQKTKLEAAIDLAKQDGPFDESLNSNANGNALERIIDFYSNSQK